MKILVTGGAGFIGSNIVELLVEEKHEVVVLDKFVLGTLENLETIKDKITIVTGDITNKKNVFDASDGCDIIFNEAAASSSPMFKEDLAGSVKINVEGFVNILDAARKNDSKVIYASTSSVYGDNPSPLTEDQKINPPNFYAATKFTDEHLARIYTSEYGITTTGFRYMSVYGPHEKAKNNFANLVSQFLWDMKKGIAPIIYGDGKQTRDFIFVKDIVKANLLAMNLKGQKSEIINAGTGRATDMNELINIINATLNTKITAKYIDNPVKNYIPTQLASTIKAKKVLGFEAKVTLEDGIKQLNKHLDTGGI
ncbi:SDR family NAD(P)-dependent oxidoreductase [archaeon]|nr:SDR family NAD(P)-dependent oxidoreductase [archaeon]